MRRAPFVEPALAAAVARAAALPIVIALSLQPGVVPAAVPADEAAKLRTTLTPTGAERTGNADGSIPPWTGGLTTPTPGFVNGGRRPDPFAGEKPLFSISAKNMAQYADKLSEGTKALLAKYPDYRLDVYKTQRSFAAPPHVYERTAKNATTTQLSQGTASPFPVGYVGGYPFPIPKSGEEAMFNHALRWSTEGFFADSSIYMVTAQGKPLLQARNEFSIVFPYMAKSGPEPDDGVFTRSRFLTSAPSLAKGGGAVTAFNIDPDKSLVYAYLTGQRRVKMVPNACCDTPAPGTGGVVNFDELNVFDGTLKTFDWKLVGKKELYVPYNSNRVLVPANDSDVLAGRFVNPDHVRWELHRVWVVEATLKPGRRHVNPKSRYYLDEDSWAALLGDRYDAQGTLVKTNFALAIVLPDAPAISSNISGAYDLLTGQWMITNVMNGAKTQFQLKTDFAPHFFTPDALAGEGVR